MAEQSVIISARVPKKVADDLQRIADDQMRTVSQLVSIVIAGMLYGADAIPPDLRRAIDELK